MRGLSGLLALAALAALLAGCGASTVPAVHSEPERLALGRQALERREYNVAIELLKSYVANNGGGAEVDQALEQLGETYLRIREWGEAQTQLERVLRDYPESDSAAAASYYLGVALWGQTRGADFDQEYTQKALAQWESYLRSYPGHWQNGEGEKRAQAARERLATKLADTGTLYLKLNRTDAARLYFQRVLDEYPGTAVVENAHYGFALADERDGETDKAIAALREIAKRDSALYVGRLAKRDLARLERHAKKKK